MIRLAAERGWEFEFEQETVPVESVFNHAVYAPALLVAADRDLGMRNMPCDLGFELSGEPNSLFGAKVSFTPEKNSYFSQIMRIGTTAMIIESLPRNGNLIQLDLLQSVLGDDFANFVAPKDAD